MFIKPIQKFSGLIAVNFAIILMGLCKPVMADPISIPSGEVRTVEDLEGDDSELNGKKIYLEGYLETPGSGSEYFNIKQSQTLVKVYYQVVHIYPSETNERSDKNVLISLTSNNSRSLLSIKDKLKKFCFYGKYNSKDYPPYVGTINIDTTGNYGAFSGEFKSGGCSGEESKVSDSQKVLDRSSSDQQSLDQALQNNSNSNNSTKTNKISDIFAQQKRDVKEFNFKNFSKNFIQRYFPVVGSAIYDK